MPHSFPFPREEELPGEALVYSGRIQALLVHYPSSLTHLIHRVTPAARSSRVGFCATRFSIQLRFMLPAPFPPGLCESYQALTRAE